MTYMSRIYDIKVLNYSRTGEYEPKIRIDRKRSLYSHVRLCTHLNYGIYDWCIYMISALEIMTKSQFLCPENVSKLHLIIFTQPLRSGRI